MRRAKARIFMISGNYSNNNNQVNNIPYGAIKDVVPNDVNQKLPENIQNLDAKQIANNNGALATTQNLNKKTVLWTLPVYGGFVALRSLNDSTKPFGFAGQYEKTVLGKLSKAGDLITKGIRKIIPDKFEFWAIDKAKSAKQWALDHSAIARSWTTPIKYENKMAIDSANGLFGRVMFDNAIMIEKGYKGGVEELRSLFGKDTKIWKLLTDRGIEKCAGNPEGARKIASGVLRELGEKSVKDKKVQEYAKEIVESFAKSDQKIVIDKWGKFPIGKIPIIGRFFTLKVPASEISNKLRVSANISGKELAGGAAGTAVGVSALGRALPSGFAKIHEGLTSDFVGGKIAPIMQAYFIASAALKAKDAPKGQKLATFMDEESGAASFLITMPIATSLLARAGGMKYIGMGANKTAQTAAVDKFRGMVKALNAKIDAGTISRGEYVQEAKKIKEFLKGDTKFWQKPFKLLGRIIGSNYKAETIKPFLENVDNLPADASKLKVLGASVSNRLQSLLYRLKTGCKVDGRKAGIGGTFGGALRFALVMFVLSPIVSKPIKWAVNKIFGKPYDPEGDKKAEAKKAKKEAKKQGKKGVQNQENPFANLTEEQMLTLLQKNQANMQKAQQDPALVQELQSDPKKLYDFLVKGAAEYDNALQNQAPSSLLQNYANKVKQGQVQPSVNQAAPIQNAVNLNQNNFNANAQMPAPSIQTQNTQNNEQQTQAPVQAPEPNRSYIPSSAPSQNVLNAQSQKNAQFNAVLQDMDRVEKEYSKYLNI